MKNYMEVYEPEYKYNVPVIVAAGRPEFIKTHCHDYSMELVYCVRGKVRIDDDSGHTNVFTPGEMMLLESETPHRLYGDKDALIISVNINLADTAYGWEKFTLSYYWCNDKSCMPHQRGVLSKVKELLLTIAYHYTCEIRDASWEEDIRKLTGSLLDVIVYEFSWFVIPEFTATENEKYRPRMDWVLKYIIQHYTEKISLSEIARQEHVNANYFSQFLKRTSFGSFTTMTNYVRCLFAERLLLTTDMNMEEIAARCGFSSKNYFHKYFRLECGNTPLQHRKHMLKDINEADRVEWLSKKETHTLVQDVLCDAILKLNLE